MLFSEIKTFHKFSFHESLANLKHMPQVFNIPKVEHDQPCSTLVVLFFKISLFIYVILGNGPISAKNNVNKQTNFEKQNNQSWAWLIMLNFGNVKNPGHKSPSIWLIIWHAGPQLTRVPWVVWKVVIFAPGF